MTITFMETWKSEKVNPLSITIGHYMNIEGVRIHYLQKGEGQPVILIHGLGAYSYTWRYNFDELAHDFKVYALDLKGFGLSDKPKKTGYSIDDHVKLVQKFIEKIEEKPVHLVGSSMGGEIGLRICLDSPELIDKLVLIGSSGYRDRIPWYYRVLGYLPYNQWVKRYIQKKYLKEELLAQVVKDAFYDPEKLKPQEIKNYIYPVFLTGFEEAYLSLFRKFDFGKRLNEYSAIQHQALILAGENDRVIPLQHLQRLNQDLSNSTLVTLKKAGHFLHEERPEVVNQLIHQFLLNN
ncbi:MAG TPA: alpha/beta hydrolase [Bacillota bacterium]|nr:alpha/beta hydrolase [Bacillota bacterium]